MAKQVDEHKRHVLVDRRGGIRKLRRSSHVLPNRDNTDTELKRSNEVDFWVRHMRSGNFSAAWEISDAIMKSRRGISCEHWPRHRQFVWNGESIEGRRVLIRCYHGLGDTIQFVRYATRVRAQARELTLWVQPSLVEFLNAIEGVDRLLPLHDGNPEVAYDVDLEIMELPHLFRSTLASLPSGIPYLPLPAILPPPPPRNKRRQCQVGVVWRAGEWDASRSIPAVLLANLARIPGVSLCALQRGPGLAEWQKTYGPALGDDDVTAAARAMQTLDLIISVDSFPAHLAGALGRPVWILLHSASDWRWMDARADSPWYPTMRLFRQKRPGDWESVVADVALELRQFAANIVARER